MVAITMIEALIIAACLLVPAGAVVGLIFAAIVTHGMSSEDEIRKRHRATEMRLRREAADRG